MTAASFSSQLQPQGDPVLPSLAFASLPPNLQISSFGDDRDPLSSSGSSTCCPATQPFSTRSQARRRRHRRVTSSTSKLLPAAFVKEKPSLHVINLFLQDADVLWLRDPFRYLSLDEDFQVACDFYVEVPLSLANLVNTGFVYARVNNRTISLYKYWYKAREVFPGLNDQNVFDQIKQDEALKKIGDTQYIFWDYILCFCQPSDELEKVVTMHANCCFFLQSSILLVVFKLDQDVAKVDEGAQFFKEVVDRGVGANFSLLRGIGECFVLPKP
ncbi:hypothetical protein L7F22_036546 [Adiantum nelumboides]|nr:hypothetical protein [Adiantum nelumboides]